MANLKSSLKDVRRTARRTLRNCMAKSALKTLARDVRESTGGEGAKAAAVAYVSAIDKAVKRGIVHKNRANRKKSALSAAIFGASTANG
ncbi:MAG: 30S ribosomal protein S20 [Puniceicoccales bacterium]|jgi:small subunit ribosomal protein S20|nr:30S ribosomal protein S20 [Puniceicoccales bacterium]